MRRTLILCAAIAWSCGDESTSGPKMTLLEDGTPCAADAECVSGQCLARVDGAVCGARCGAPDECTSGACLLAEIDASDGSAAGRTIEPVCAPITTGARMFGADCSSDDSCASGLCDEGVCTELCRDTCSDATRSICEATDLIRFETSVRASVCKRRLLPDLVFGPVDTPAAGSDPLRLDIPSGLASFSVVLVDDDGLRVGVRSLVSPDARMFFDHTAFGDSLNPAAAYIGTTSMMVPVSDDPAAAPIAGPWQMTVGTFDPDNFTDLDPVDGQIERIEVFFEPEAEIGGRLDLHIALAPGFGATATTASTTPFVTDLVGRLERLLLEPADVQLGSLTYAVLDEAHDRVEDGDETRQMCRDFSVHGPHGTSINLLVVRDLDYTSGHSGGIPGPPGVIGTNASCVVIEQIGNGRATGVLAAHELGHMLGLFHTTFLQGGFVDPISDTESCAVGTAVEDCPDYRNLMFPVFPVRDDLALTDGQISVLRVNPALYDPLR